MWPHVGTVEGHGCMIKQEINHFWLYSACIADLEYMGLPTSSLPAEDFENSAFPDSVILSLRMWRIVGRLQVFLVVILTFIFSVNFVSSFNFFLCHIDFNRDSDGDGLRFN